MLKLRRGPRLAYKARHEGAPVANSGRSVFTATDAWSTGSTALCTRPTLIFP